ncbi:hypothetical protein Q8F55_001201 [Vanrija albida]|uniref:Uncharacterized protein n=1 Tax=Vanrija albida TaxID=181172 RepID=A0ABR3QFD4_9TREE
MSLQSDHTSLLSESPNPGLMSETDTQLSYQDAFDHTRLRTPPPDEDVEAGYEILIEGGNAVFPSKLDQFTQVKAISRADVATDPILNRFAKVQMPSRPPLPNPTFRQSQQLSTTAQGPFDATSTSPSSSFKARPAPETTYIDGLGPRLTKSAALRQGLQWQDPRDMRKVSGEDVPVDFTDVPGHKRTGLALTVASLAEPTLQPRQNRAAMLRAGHIPGDAFSPSISRAEIAARNKAREAAERAEKRRSVQLPASLVSPPELAPRQNRASQLRLGQAPSASPYRDPKEVAEQAVRNKARDAAERAEKIKSVQLPTSLTSSPAIAPRANRASMLRTGTGEVVAPPPIPRRSHLRPVSVALPSKRTSMLETSPAPPMPSPPIPNTTAPEVKPVVRQTSIPSLAPQAAVKPSTAAPVEKPKPVVTQQPMFVERPEPVDVPMPVKQVDELPMPSPPMPWAAARTPSGSPSLTQSSKMSPILRTPATPGRDPVTPPAPSSPSSSISLPIMTGSRPTPPSALTPLTVDLATETTPSKLPSSTTPWGSQRTPSRSALRVIKENSPDLPMGQEPDKDKAKKSKTSGGVGSLGTPKIQPRANRASMLRENPASVRSASPSSLRSARSAKSAKSSKSARSVKSGKSGRSARSRASGKTASTRSRRSNSAPVRQRYGPPTPTSKFTRPRPAPVVPRDVRPASMLFPPDADGPIGRPMSMLIGDMPPVTNMRPQTMLMTGNETLPPRRSSMRRPVTILSTTIPRPSSRSPPPVSPPARISPLPGILLPNRSPPPPPHVISLPTNRTPPPYSSPSLSPSPLLPPVKIPKTSTPPPPLPEKDTPKSSPGSRLLSKFLRPSHKQSKSKLKAGKA